MAPHKVTTPVAGFSGSVGGVTFADGAAVVDDEQHTAELAYFRAQGYDVAEVDDVGGEDPVPDLEALRSDAAALGIEVDNRWKAKRLQSEIDAALAANGEPNENTETDSAGIEPAGDEENDQP